MQDKLNQLGELAGILPDYYDIWGKRHEATEATKRALLTAMGALDGNTPDIDGAILQIEKAIWTECLPPVHVCLIDQPIEVICRLSESGCSQPCYWRITLENGDTFEGTFNPAELEQTGSHSDDKEQLVAVSLALPVLRVIGYHTLEIGCSGAPLAHCALIVCPPVAYFPPAFADGNRLWGLSIQLYGLRTRNNWGLGDFADLLPALDWAAESGASLIGLNPLHALFPHNPEHCSPYSPSSRQFINVLHIDVETVPEFAECKEAQKHVSAPAFQSRLAELRTTDLVDYKAVAEAKFSVLELLYTHFREQHLKQKTVHAEAFLEFQKQAGEDLRLFALYHALQDYFYAKDNALWGWPVWPQAYQSHTSTAVEAFAQAHVERVEWHLWLQWQADEQLKTACRHAAERGLGIGLYQDLAVGVDKGGAETWIHQDLYALDCRIGCPPDDFNLLGQDWGLPPWIPNKLRAAAYRPYIAMLRANMKYAGALRIDHVMGLMRLYWIPPGMKGDAGAYLAYPFRDLLAIMALESHRNQCVIVGEDLGTVPDEVRHALHDLGVLTYRLFYFERQQDGHFMPPAWYPEQALVAASTHDLPTLAGYWKGRDIEVRTALNQFPNDDVRTNQIAGRREDKARLLADLAREGLLPEGISTNPDDIPELTPALLRAVLHYIARTPSRIALVQAEDMLGQEEQANLPGTVNEHPNWRRKLSLELEQWQGNENCQATGAAMALERALR
jgi:(1->4)-alpha-D-glucan 1-alpha-D-glucosylmutase